MVGCASPLVESNLGIQADTHCQLRDKCEPNRSLGMMRLRRSGDNCSSFSTSQMARLRESMGLHLDPGTVTHCR